MSLKPKETLSWKMPIFFNSWTLLLLHIFDIIHTNESECFITSSKHQERDESAEPTMKYEAHVFDMSSIYTLYHPTQGKPRPGARKILFNERGAKQINPENPPFLTKFVLRDRTVKVESAWRSTVGTTGNPGERLSRAEMQMQQIANPRLHNYVLSGGISCSHAKNFPPTILLYNTLYFNPMVPVSSFPFG